MQMACMALMARQFQDGMLHLARHDLPECLLSCVARQNEAQARGHAIVAFISTGQKAT